MRIRFRLKPGRGSGLRFWTLLLCICSGLAPQSPVAARPVYPAVVRMTYPLKANGVVEKALDSCLLCHDSPGPPRLNPYGNDVRAALTQANTRTLTPALLRSINDRDSDGDGFTNAAEFAADTLPGDTTSKPAGTPSAAPQIVSQASTVAAASAEASAADLKPFSPKAMLFPKHAQHPIIIHFPIALFVISLLFDLLGSRRKDGTLVAAGFYNLIVAAVSAYAAVGSGLLAWRFQYGGAALTGILRYHLILGITLTLLLTLLAWMRARRRAPEQPVSRAYFALAVLALVIIVITGHLGGILSGVVS
jgi:uncharacterized membrane protein